MSDWLTTRALKKDQRVRAYRCDFRKPFSEREEVEGTVIKDTNGMFEVLDIDVNGVKTVVFYPHEILS
jgi:hypothetical protein